jgi:hypothetical protein
MKNIFWLMMISFLTQRAFSSTKEEPSLNILKDEDKIKIVSALLKNQAIVFNPNENSQIGCPKGQTLGAYVARLIVTGSQGDNHFLTVSCFTSGSNNGLLPQLKKSSNKKDCKLSSFSSDRNGSSPWSNELVFRISSDYK